MGDGKLFVKIYLLGSPQVVWNGKSLHIPRKQLRAMLYVLAVYPKPLAREQLYGLFWPDIPDLTARRNLTRLIALLRGCLPQAGMLLTDDEQITLDSQQVWCDVLAFERLNNLTSLSKDILPLQQAAQLYRAPFLQGFSLPHNADFETWANLRRQTYERQHLANLLALMDACSAKGELARAVAYALNYLAVDDLAEDVHCRLIALYAASGDRTQALRQYERCAAILERELGVSPLPETQAIYRSVLKGTEPPAAQRPAHIKWDMATPSTPIDMQIPRVGYENVLQRLNDAYQRAAHGQGGMILVWGEAGIGKTHLLQQFANLLPAGTRSLHSSGYADAQATPYQPILQLMRSGLSAGLTLADVEQTWLIEAMRLLPELRNLYPDLPQPIPLEPDQVRARLLEALCRLVLAMRAAPQPLVIFLDDLQWADTVTLEWLCILGRRLRGAPVLVVGAYNPEEPNLAKVKAVLGGNGLQHSGVLTEIELTGLEEPAILTLLRHFIGNTPGDAAAAGRLRLATGGNPFFLLEIMHALVESGGAAGGGRRAADGGTATLSTEQPWITADAEWPVTNTVQNVVRDRLQRLTAIGRQVLDAAAILGPGFEFDVIQRTAGRKEIETLDGLDELISRRILQEHGDSYRFVHEIMRQTVYHNLSYWRKRLLHRRAGEAIQGSAVGYSGTARRGNPAALIYHFERAEQPGQAAWYALQAGLSARDLYAHTEASAFFNHALDLLEIESSTLHDPRAIEENWRLRIQILEGRGWVLRLLGDMAAYERDLEEVSRLAALLGDQTTMAHLRWREAVSLRWHCRYPEARFAAQEGVLLSQSSGSPLLEARCLREEGLAAREMGEYKQARSSLELALHAFIDLENTVFEIHSLGNLSRLFWYLGDFNRAGQMAHQAMDRCSDTSQNFQRRIPLGDMGAAMLGNGDLSEARISLQESLDISRQIDDRTQEIFCLGHLGWLHNKEEQPEMGRGYLNTALNLAQTIGSVAEQSWLLAGMAEASWMKGETQNGLQHARKALALAHSNGRTYDETLARNIINRLEHSYL